MKTCIAILVLLVVAGTVYTQTPPPIPSPDNPALPSVPAAPSVQAASSQPKERSINQILDEIQALRTQKEELAKKEQALMAEVRKLVGQQTERLNKMGLAAPVQTPAAVDFGVPVLTPSSTATPPIQGTLPATPAKR